MSSAKPAPRAITGCRNLGILFLLLLFAAPLATRCGLISYPLGLPLTALAVLGAALVLIMVLLMLPRVRYRAHRSRLGMIALIAALPVIAGVVVMAPGAGLPVIHDLSTDISDPPVFEAVLALRGEKDYVPEPPSIQTVTVPGGHISPLEAPRQVQDFVQRVIKLAESA